MDKIKPVKIKDDKFTLHCGNCYEKVEYTYTTGERMVGGSESYYDYRNVKHKYCPNCGCEIEYDD